MLPFDVLQGDQGWRALVTWVGGGLDVSVIRPDGSRLRVGATGPNERVTSAPNSWAAEGGNPRPGRYRVELKAQRTNVERINVSIDSWQRKPPGRLVYEDFTGAPQPSGAPGCESTLTFKSIEVKASCLRRVPGADVYRADGRIRINGLDVVPEGTGSVEIAPKDLKLETVGSATVSLGSVKLTTGKLNWTLQAPELKVARDTKIKGFPVKGEATAKFAGGALNLDINVGFPSVLGGVTGAATLKATNDTGLQLDALSVKATEAKVRAIPIKDIALAYKKVPEGDRWEGGAKVELPFKGGFGVAGSAAFLNGQFAEARGAVNGNFSVGFGVFLQEVRLGLVLQPDFALSGGMTLSAGPKVVGKTASSVKGDFTYQSGDPATFALTGEIKLVDFSLANGNVTYSTSGQLTVGGKLAFDVAGFGLDAQVDGFVQSSAFQVAGTGKVKTPVKDVDGDGLLSNKGIAGCGDFLFGEVGFGYTWGDRLPEVMAGSCDVGEWKVSPAASAAQQQSRTYRLRGGQRLAAFAAVGNGGPPAVTLTGPGGRTVVTPPSGPGFATENEVVFRYAADSTTYVAVARPAAGRWTITANPGSPPLTETRQADGLPEPRVRARVRGRGSRRVLVFRAKRISGQRLRFAERGAGVGRTLATTRRARGRIRFRPADGPRGRRVIQVDVLQQGLPRERLNVASYRAPSPSTPGRVRGLRLRKASRGRVLASWGVAARADRYRVSITVSDGRRLIRTAQRRRLTITGVGRREQVLVRVRAVNALGRQGDARIARTRR